MTEYAWPAWALTNHERCQPHGDPGCTECQPPWDENDYRLDDPDTLDTAQDLYEATHLGWGPE